MTPRPAHSPCQALAHTWLGQRPSTLAVQHRGVPDVAKGPTELGTAAPHPEVAMPGMRGTVPGSQATAMAIVLGRRGVSLVVDGC